MAGVSAIAAGLAKGVELKVLMEDKETGLLTALTRFAPGTKLPDHEHTEVEQVALSV